MDLFSRSNSDVAQLIEVMREAIRGRRVTGFFFKTPDSSTDWWRLLQGGVEVTAETTKNIVRRSYNFIYNQHSSCRFPIPCHSRADAGRTHRLRVQAPITESAMSRDVMGRRTAPDCQARRSHGTRQRAALQQRQLQLCPPPTLSPPRQVRTCTVRLCL